MPDREKVMTGLELCTNISQDGCLMLCPHKDEKDETYSGFCEQVLKQDALALLKEQEAVEPITQSSVYDPDTWFYVCGSCKKSVIDRGDKFCRWCGKPILWEGR